MKEQWDHRNGGKIFLLFLVLALLLFIVPSRSPGCQYNIVAEASYAEFRLESREGNEVAGKFEEISGQFLYDKERPHVNTFLIRIHADSVKTVPSVYEQIFFEEKFFHAKENPFFVFSSDWYCDSLDQGVVEGKLSIKGIKKKVSFYLQKKSEKHIDGKGDRISVELNGEIDLREFGLRSDELSAEERMELRIWMEGLRE